jgi:dTDP-4-amino-4,6-dideoxygalactose transaminase
MTDLLATIANPRSESVPTGSGVPFCRLTDLIESTRFEWEPRLDALFRRGHFVLGEEVAAFEQEFAAFLGANFAVGVANGTDAISLALRAARVSGEVCTTALTAPFTAIAIRAAGLKPRFVDIDGDTLQIDPVDLEQKLAPQVSAVVPVHLYGQPCPIERIAGLTTARGLTLIQDACQAHGARSESGRPFTDFGDFVAFSFYPTKNLGCLGDGGAIVTNRATVDRRLRLLRDGGRRKGHVSWVAGINSRLDEIQACFLRVFLSRLTSSNETRKQLAVAYDEALSNCPGIRLVRRTSASVCHLYVVRADRRTDLRECLTKAGIQTGIHYARPLHLHPAFQAREQGPGSLPKAEAACQEILSLPLWSGMKIGDVFHVADRIRSFYS